MLKWIWFQLHWLLGITAGTVLAVMGFTGATLSFEGEILRWLNPAVTTVTPPAGAQPVTPVELLQRLADTAPGRLVVSINLSSDPELAARVSFVPEQQERGGRREGGTEEAMASGPPPAEGENRAPRGERMERPANQDGPPGMRQERGAGREARAAGPGSAENSGRPAGRPEGQRGPAAEAGTGAAPAAAGGTPPQQRRPRVDTRYVDPYTGALLGSTENLKGQSVLAFMENLHRRLASGNTGKAITGASVLCLVVLSLSGLYLRWPRRMLDWRAWFKVDFSLKGRSFLWNLHSVVGTWVLVPYLLVALTGLWWSYGWYRDGVIAVLGTKPAERARGPEGRPLSPDLQVLDTVWQSFSEAVQPQGYSQATVNLPNSADAPYQLTYLDADPQHDRATNRLTISADGRVSDHRRYADKALNEQIVSSIFPLHAGSFFGLPGRLIMMVSAGLMPLFAITGWMLYLERRRRKAEVRKAAAAVSGGTSAMPGQVPWVVAYASQTGNAERLAWQAAASLQAGGKVVEVHSLHRLSLEKLATYTRGLFVVSTFGDGEPPDNTRSFARKLAQPGSALSGFQYGLLSLGDRNYAQFCGFGRSLRRHFDALGAQPLFEAVEAEAGEADALAAWRDRLAHFGASPVAEVQPAPAPLQTWRLAARDCINPGSAGDPVYEVQLEWPASGAGGAAMPTWEAGDIAMVEVQHDPARVEAWLQQLGFSGSEPVTPRDAAAASLTLRELALRSELPAVFTLTGLDAAQTARQLRPLLPREYSIASIPQEGRLGLLLRQAWHDGVLGVGSGWLSRHAAVGGEIRLRLRANPSFRLVDEERPLVLIGNGTGLAGLRALLKAAELRGWHRNWLIFGERNQQFDAFHDGELRALHEKGVLARLDRVYSRDQPQKRYVQDLVREYAEELRVWIAAGAVLHICGSLAGMAPEVEAALIATLGEAGFDALVEAEGYRRDVY